jgi:hypothetical protein
MKGWLNREPFTPIVMPRDCSMSVAVSALSATRSGAMPPRQDWIRRLWVEIRMLRQDDA